MYKVICDGYTLHDPAMNDDTRLIEGGKVVKKANYADSFSFTIYPENINYDKVKTLSSVVEVYKDEERIFYGRPVSCAMGWLNQKAFVCEGVYAFFNDTILRPYSFNGSVADYVRYLVNKHNEQEGEGRQVTVRTVTVTDPNNYIVRANGDYVPTLQEMNDKLIGYLGGYIVMEVAPDRTIYLDYLADSTSGTGQTVEIAKNLIDFKKKKDGSNVVTGLIPLGARNEETGEYLTIKSVNSGLDYIVDNDAAAEYGLIFAVEKWENVTLPANLLTKAQARLAEMVSIIPRITLTAIDLSLIDQSMDPIEFMDYVTVVDDAHGASGRYLITERIYNLSAPENDQITFGKDIKTISGETARNKTQSVHLSETVYNEAMEAVHRATELITGEDGGHIKIKCDPVTGVPEQILIMDTDDESTATRIWRWNLSGLAYSSDGGQTYTLAITADGEIVADFITVGTLDANKITVRNLRASSIFVSPSVMLDDDLARIDDAASSAQTAADNAQSAANAAASTADTAVTNAANAQASADQVLAITNLIRTAMAELSADVGVLQNYITTDGDGALRISASNSDFSIRIDAAQITFYQGTNALAWFSGNTFIINSGTVYNMLNVGNFSLAMRPNGHLSLIYNGS